MAFDLINFINEDGNMVKSVMTMDSWNLDMGEAFLIIVGDDKAQCDNSMKFREPKKICVDLFFVFDKFQWDSRIVHKIQSYFQGSRIQNKFQAFHGAVGTLSQDAQ